jgi:DNA-binding response OmpR family regulator
MAGVAAILLVEDDPSVREAVSLALEGDGHRVETAVSGEEALGRWRRSRPDLILLDVMLPKITGLDVCKTLRGDGNRVPIIMLTARGQEIDKVLGLKLGADDYVTKPFGFMELMARVEAVLRRCASSAEAPPPQLETYRFGDVTLDFRAHEAWKGGKTIELSPREFQLLGFFIQHRGEVVTREKLLDTVWDYNAIPFTRTVDMHIAKLRKKIEDNPADPRHVITVHRLGYKFVG